MTDVNRIEQLVGVAEDILEGRIGITEGARKLSAFRSEKNLEADPDLLVATGVDSETDSFPLGDVRDLWNPAALKSKDAERAAVENHYHDYLMAACRRLVEKFKQ